MALHHYAGLKIASWIATGLGALYLILDPTVKVAIIVAIPGTITAILSVVTHFQLRAIKTDVNSNLTRMANEKQVKTDQLAAQGKELSIAQEKLAHAEGVKQGSDTERSKATP